MHRNNFIHWNLNKVAPDDDKAADVIRQIGALWALINRCAHCSMLISAPALLCTDCQRSIVGEEYSDE